MTPAESYRRVWRELRKSTWRRQAGHGLSPAPLRAERLAFLYGPFVDPIPLAGAEKDPCIREADAYLRHEWMFFGLDHVAESPIDWHRDPITGRTAPRIFGQDIDHRDAALVGNARATWEKNRHHHLVVLARAFALTGDERYATEVADQIEDWIRSNPFRVGINWTHGLEVAIRLLSWIWCERWLRNSASHARLFHPDSTLWRSAYEHQRFILETGSFGSSANNHRIGEMAGLFIAASAWPVFPESAAWRKHARRTLEVEVFRQTFPSGLDREQAFGYHVFALEFLLLALIESDPDRGEFPRNCRQRVGRMLAAIPMMTDTGGHVPRYGDGDEGMAVQFLPRSSDRSRWLHAIGTHLPGLDVPAAVPPGSFAFPDAGMFVLANRRGTPDEIWVLCDAGPHGYLSIAAHAHADALSFAYSAGGVPFIVDPGTYTYYTDPDWREYFRGTAAHNTVVVDGRDQSLQGGTFLWLTQATGIVREWTASDTRTVLTAEHDGYDRLGIRHQRRWDLQGNRLTLDDRFTGRGSHDLCFRFHLAPECEIVSHDSSCVVVRRSGVTIRVRLPAELRVQMDGGGTRAGWYSPRFGVRVQTHTLSAEGRLSMPAALTTVIERVP